MPVRSPSASGASSEIADNLLRLNHMFSRFRACIQAADIDGDKQLHYLLFQVLIHGPMRSSVLADLAQIDPSTVSRQVATLVQDGLLERRADPDDGRAVLLHATDKASARHERHLVQRNAHYTQMLADWSEEDLARFADLLARFAASFEVYRPTFLAAITERVDEPRPSTTAPREAP